MSPMRIFSANRIMTVFCAAALALFFVGPALAHSPGGHGESSFTALKALDNGVAL